MLGKYTVYINHGITVIELLVTPTYIELKAILDDVAENYPYEKRLYNLGPINFDFSFEEDQLDVRGSWLIWEENWKGKGK